MTNLLNFGQTVLSLSIAQTVEQVWNSMGFLLQQPVNTVG